MLRPLFKRRRGWVPFFVVCPGTECIIMETGARDQTGSLVKIQIILKNILAGIWALLAAALVVVVVLLHIESRDVVFGRAAAWTYSFWSLVLVVPLGLLAYGLFKSRRWVFHWHSILLGFLIFFDVVAVIKFGEKIYRTRDLTSIIVVLAVFVFPIIAEVFLFRIRNTVLTSVAEGSKEVTVVSTILGCVAVIPAILGVIVIGIAMSIGGSPAQDRVELSQIENDRFKVTVYHLPSNHATVGEYTQIIFVDKNSLLKGEKEILWKRGVENYFLEFIDSNTVRFISAESKKDTVICNLLDPKNAIPDDCPVPPFRLMLDYEGCEDDTLAENDSYVVTLRKYPPANKASIGFLRLLVTDKTDWFPSEEVLLEACQGDSIEARFIGNDSLSVSMTLGPNNNLPADRIGEVVTYDFDLENVSEVPVSYPMQSLARQLTPTNPTPSHTGK